MRITIFLVLVLAGCTSRPNLDGAISSQSLSADYPELIALDAQTVPWETSTGATVISELDARTNSLWARISTLFN